MHLKPDVGIFGWQSDAATSEGRKTSAPEKADGMDSPESLSSGNPLERASYFPNPRQSPCMPSCTRTSNAMSLEAALRRDDEPKFLDEDESVHYHVTKAGTVVCKSVALVTLPRDHEMKHLDVVVWFDGEGDSQVEMGPAEITHGLRYVCVQRADQEDCADLAGDREGEEDWIALENLRKQTVQPMVGKSGRKEYVVRIYSAFVGCSVGWS
jgi:hypothetical protein